MINFLNINISKNIVIRCYSFIALILIWHFLSILLNNNVFPSPLLVFKVLINNIKEGELLIHLAITLYRVFLSFFLAMIIGTFFGIIMGVKKNINVLLDGWNILFLNIPALVIIILCYVWFGLNEIAAIIAVSLNKIPNVIVTIREGAKAVDNKLIEVAKVFKVNSSSTFFNFFLPQIYPYIMAAARSGISLIWKIVLVVELLGRSNGIGFKLHEFFQFFDIASILAYTFSFVIVMLAIENFIFVPLDNVANKWRNI